MEKRSVKVENARKILIGESFNNCIKYQKGSKYRQPNGQCELVDFIQNEEDPNLIDIYLKPPEGAIYLWKSMSKRMLLEVEYDSSFGE